MQSVGNAVTILGILVTLVAYFGQHSGVSLADLEPGLVRRWNKGRAWVRRKLGRRPRNTTLNVHFAAHATSALTATVLPWSPIRPGDDIAVRADKLARNLDALRDNIEARGESDRKEVSELRQLVMTRVKTLEQTVAARHEESRQATTAAMRWEVRGLFITLVGAGLAILG